MNIAAMLLDRMDRRCCGFFLSGDWGDSAVRAFFRWRRGRVLAGRRSASPTTGLRC